MRGFSASGYLLLRRTLLILASLHAGAMMLYWLPSHWVRTDTERDVRLYYLAANRLRAGEPLYPTQDARLAEETKRFVSGGPAPVRWFMYQPSFAALISPLAELSFLSFARIWYLLLLAAFWLYAWSLARLASGRSTLSGILIGGLVIMAVPGAYRAMSLGQADPILWALFGTALAWRGRGIFLAVSTFMKPFALWALLCAFWREGRGTAIAGAITLAVGLLLGAAAAGVSSYAAWARFVVPVAGQGTFDSDNVSLSFAVLRIAGLLGWEYSGGLLPGWARWYLAVIGIAVPALTMWLARTTKPVMQYALVMSAAILFSPYCWSTYIPLLLCPLALLAGRMDRRPEARLTRDHRPETSVEHNH